VVAVADLVGARLGGLDDGEGAAVVREVPLAEAEQTVGGKVSPSVSGRAGSAQQISASGAGRRVPGPGPFTLVIVE
jgi:hypothetical protein